ncbi:MAG TPA: hypothetical protein VMS76_16425 [Planctomycetota bacterium]|nr:hypothetical protein [Planctomycetota bacterium]
MSDSRAIRSISVLMPTWQKVAYLERVLAALASQQLGQYAGSRGSLGGAGDG